MRTVVFNEDEQSKERFSIYWQGFAVGDPGLKGIEQLELGVRIVKKLKGVSVVDPADLNNRLLNGIAVIKLEEDEYGRLLRSLQDVPWKPLAAEKAFDAIEYLKGIPADVEDTGVAPEARKD